MRAAQPAGSAAQLGTKPSYRCELSSRHKLVRMRIVIGHALNEAQRCNRNVIVRLGLPVRLDEPTHPAVESSADAAVPALCRRNPTMTSPRGCCLSRAPAAAPLGHAAPDAELNLVVQCVCSAFLHYRAMAADHRGFTLGGAPERRVRRGQWSGHSAWDTQAIRSSNFNTAKHPLCCCNVRSACCRSWFLTRAVPFLPVAILRPPLLGWQTIAATYATLCRSVLAESHRLYKLGGQGPIAQQSDNTFFWGRACPSWS